MSRFQVNQNAVKKMSAMGIHPAMAEQALQLTGNNIQQAVLLVMKQMGGSGGGGGGSRQLADPPKSKRTGKPICHMCESEDTEITLTNLVDFGCRHLCCEQCLRKHCDNFVTKRKRSYVLVPCTFDGCNEYCPIPIVEKYLSEEGKKFVEHIKNTTLPKVLPNDPCPRTFSLPLRDFGYHYDNRQRFRHIQTGEPYYYINERHYIAIGDAIVKEIQNILVNRFNLKEYFCDPKRINNIFRSEENHEKLMIIIEGSGAVRPGQWARGLCMNEDLHTGSCIDYVDLALRQKYDVILLNPNCRKVRKNPWPVSDRFDWTITSKPGPLPAHNTEMVENCETGLSHTKFVYDNFIKPKNYKHYFIVAHSAGGYHTMELLRTMRKNKSFFSKLVAIGFTDSVHSISFDEYKVVKEFVTNNAVNWAKSREDLDTLLKRKSSRNCRVVSAGHHKHENTSASCMNSLFKFFNQKFEQKMRNM